MLVICSILLAVDAGGVAIISKADVEGTVLKESDTKYLVDFSKGVTKYGIKGDPKDYSKILVNRTECVKE